MMHCDASFAIREAENRSLDRWASGGDEMEKHAAPGGAGRRIAITLVIVLSIASATFALAARAEPNEAAADQFWQAALATNARTNEFPSIVLRVNAAAAQDCCKVCTAGKACGDTCISREKTCRVGPGCACDG